GAAPRHRVGPESPSRLPVVWVQHRQPAPAQQVTLGHPGVLRPLLAEVVTGAVRRGAPDQLRQCLGQTPPTPLTLPQRLLGPLLAGDVQSRNVPHERFELPLALPQLLLGLT